ncbi:hypothetical protein HBH70_097770 [Parastagonospora nodorum]|nr:hypothetical protein HBH46_104820 [Parastagonospora nodorum]KAH5138882.1 hypothetical protein HBH70_097770 [Parastagonospora nodorum]KAH5267049.1 hypothetical protein HBI72_081690 [Parastagonospora nodorum]KAH5307223.1 hypothetical protein HBI12_163970 [Parastagonospora nodorum]KAH5583007.1 hypothetical protein HBI26_121620 [Parastagonospora nodorum]
MAKIAIAGGAGNVASEIVDVLVATEKHDIVILTRRDISTINPTMNVKFVKTDYANTEQLTQILQGVHTVLSFIAPHRNQDVAITVQKNLISASIQAGVKRFAPSEWGVKQFAPKNRDSSESLDPYLYKAATRTCLEEVNKDTKVLEYCLFQPGLFTNYLTAPYKSATHLTAFETPFDFERRRMLVVDGGENSRITFTTVQDLAHVVARAVDYEGEWPVVGGMAGTTMSVGELIALGEKIRGGTFNVTRLKEEDLGAGTWKSEWAPLVAHPSIPDEQVEVVSRALVPNILLAVNEGAFETSDEWNRLLPDYEFTGAKTFVEREWRRE